MTDPEPKKLSELMYVEATRAIDQQQPVLDGIRTRSVTVLSVGSIAIAFLATRVLDASSRSSLATASLIVAGVLYVFALLAGFGTLLPIVLETYFKPSVMGDPEWRAYDDAKTYEELARFREGQYLRNDAKLRWIWFLGMGAVMLTIGTIFLLLVSVVVA